MKHGRVRPMEVEDLRQVAGLFFKVFRKQTPSALDAFDAYARDLFFGSPLFDPDTASLVHEGLGGRIGSVITSVPLQYSIGGRVATARLLCTFMVDPEASPRAAAELTLALRPRRQDFCFTDSASPTSADHFRAIGGTVLPLQSLEWCSVFRPAAYLACLAAERKSWLRPVRARLLTQSLDGMIDRASRFFAAPADADFRVEPITPAAFRIAAARTLDGYAVRPVWSPRELDWIWAMASRNTTLGHLQALTVKDGNGVDCGCAAVFHKPGAIAQVLDVLAIEGREQPAVAALLAHLRATGHVAARGRVQPRLLQSLARHRTLFFRHKAYACVSTRHIDVNATVRNDALYVGGLAGESWSRLVTDFR